MIENKIAEDLKNDEGWRPSAYQDHLGYWTLGYGFMIDERRKGEIPGPVAEFWLNWKIDQVVDRLYEALPWLERAPDNVLRALANMGYQMGVSGLLGFRRTLGLLEVGRYEEAADEALRSRWAKQTPRRAQRVTDWIRRA